MGICPICNGFEQYVTQCQNCGSKMENKGREAEYYDDYSPYMPIDEMKLEDGYPNNFQNGECPHLFVCPNCGQDQVMMIKE